MMDDQQQFEDAEKLLGVGSDMASIMQALGKMDPLHAATGRELLLLLFSQEPFVDKQKKKKTKKQRRT